VPNRRNTPEARPFPETPEGQRQFLEEVTRIVLNAPDNLGQGIMWWEPAAAGLGHVGARISSTRREMYCP